MYRTLHIMILALLVTFLAAPAKASEGTTPDFNTILQLYREQEAKIAGRAGDARARAESRELLPFALQRAV